MTRVTTRSTVSCAGTKAQVGSHAPRAADGAGLLYLPAACARAGHPTGPHRTLRSTLSVPMMLQLPSVRAQAPAQSAPRRAARAPAPALPSSRTQCSRRGLRLRAALLQPVTEPESLPSPLERRAAPPVDDRWPTAPPDGAELRSTPAHKAVVGAWFLTLAAAAAHCAVDAQTAGLPAELVALLLSYVAADLGSGIFHWSTDNYGDRSTVRLARNGGHSS
jgi:Lipid desaturase domain